MWTSSGHACYTQILGQKVREDKYRGWTKERGFILWFISVCYEILNGIKIKNNKFNY